MPNKLQTHTVEQPDSDITAFILSCNRLDLLSRTVESFLQTRDMPTKIVILDDSGVDGVFELLVQRYGQIADIVCFPENRGLWWAKDFMISYCFTKYIFYIEDDWLFLQPGYLIRSKAILEKDRTIGSIDLSWRTFEEEGMDAYDPELVDDAYFHKKPWQITEGHLHWFCWQGSPNLKRREDLILLGRVESYYTEWNIDRKFYALGLRGVYLKDRYVTHLGDFASLMVNKRPNEQNTPEILYPEELKVNRLFPAFDYYGLDQVALDIRGDVPRHRQNKQVLVTCVLDIGREAYDRRSFLDHYIEGLEQLIELNRPLVIFVDDRYYIDVLKLTGGRPIKVISVAPELIKWRPIYPRLKEICESKQWASQSDWMQGSIIQSPDYIGLTLHKMELLMHCVNHSVFRSDSYYWVDAGMCRSYHVSNLRGCDFDKLPATRFFMTTFPYPMPESVPEMHGYSRNGFLELCGRIPNTVCRATIFGGTKQAISDVYVQYNEFLKQSLAAGYIGTEEAIFSGLAITRQELFNLVPMHTGDIRNYLNTLRH